MRKRGLQERNFPRTTYMRRGEASREGRLQERGYERVPVCGTEKTQKVGSVCQS